MAILLKELTIRYSPENSGTAQLIRDYYAMFAVWRQLGSGGSHISPTSQRKTEIIDDVFEQVATRLSKKILSDYENRQGYTKPIQKLTHAINTKNWLDFHAAIEPFIQDLGSGFFRDVKALELDPQKKISILSRSVQNFVKGLPRSGEEPPPATSEPSKATTSPSVSTPPKFKTFDKPLTAPPAATQRHLPFAGSQTDLPLTPSVKLPQMPDNLPPLGSPMVGDPKQVGANWEKLLSDFGYNWSESDNAYKNDSRNILIQIYPNNSVQVFLPSGEKITYPTLGNLFRKLVHNRKKRHAHRAGEPQAQVTKENYKMLYEFLYT